MNIIIFKKTVAEPFSQVSDDWKGNQLASALSETLQKGTIIIIKKSDFEIVAPFMTQHNILNCGIKKEKVELFRALKFDQQSSKELPRRLVANFSSIGAFKRSFFRFYIEHYQPTDPPCFLFVSDERVDELAATEKQKVHKTVSQDPLSLLLKDKITVEKADKIGEVYVGESFEIRMTRSMIYKASQTDSPVLILGESGTGKELIARQIFKYSENYNKGLFIVNCSSLPDALFESELFGHKKGSFTDARQDKEGIFAAANGGTLFLDEIGDLSLQNQAKLLRAIEGKEIRPLGSNETIKVNVRFLAATNRNLEAMMKQKTFREDLYFRLNTFTIYAYPLREHPEDIPGIASAIWTKLNKPGKLSDEFLNYLKGYSWPGNVRELKTLLNSITDIFGNVSPGPEHIEAIRNYHRKTLIESNAGRNDDFEKMLKVQSRNRIIEVQNILRAVKIELRPIINKQPPKLRTEKLHQLRLFIQQEVTTLENLCREPIFFKNRNLFDHIKRFRYLLEKMLNRWTGNADELRNLWQTDLNPLYEKIDMEIFEIIWGKMDL